MSCFWESYEISWKCALLFKVHVGANMHKRKRYWTLNRDVVARRKFFYPCQETYPEQPVLNNQTLPFCDHYRATANNVNCSFSFLCQWPMDCNYRKDCRICVSVVDIWHECTVVILLKYFCAIPWRKYTSLPWGDNKWKEKVFFFILKNRQSSRYFVMPSGRLLGNFAHQFM